LYSEPGKFLDINYNNFIKSSENVKTAEPPYIKEMHDPALNFILPTTQQLIYWGIDLVIKFGWAYCTGDYKPLLTTGILIGSELFNAYWLQSSILENVNYVIEFYNNYGSGIIATKLHVAADLIGVSVSQYFDTQMVAPPKLTQYMNNGEVFSRAFSAIAFVGLGCAITQKSKSSCIFLATVEAAKIWSDFGLINLGYGIEKYITLLQKYENLLINSYTGVSRSKTILVASSKLAPELPLEILRKPISTILGQSCVFVVRSIETTIQSFHEDRDKDWGDMIKSFLQYPLDKIALSAEKLFLTEVIKRYLGIEQGKIGIVAGAIGEYMVHIQQLYFSSGTFNQTDEFHQILMLYEIYCFKQIAEMYVDDTALEYKISNGLFAKEIYKTIKKSI